MRAITLLAFVAATGAYAGPATERMSLGGVMAPGHARPSSSNRAGAIGRSMPRPALSRA